ncbi:DUF6194 family protein [Micromonospora carbonacea]|uniref:DUF6194 domain-containing protein n=1 Tax=Micromonospora carbonacea TaxID=47853 RepID=A0A7H8XJB1_9ACTN|nr:DUF6194 family protein [Micromonospora carbonacea]MBB5827001.1 hypothetical protein [Micromonospora carbonacea]QLD25173.1 hypothetical protein HXZ27_13925 [Micromonospora carbonacea]
MTPSPPPVPAAPIPTEAELARRILALPGVTQVWADAASGAPRASWGERFFFVGPDRRRPFATIVAHDTPGFDEDSRLDRPDVHRLNVELGRAEFQRRFGYPPARFPDHRAGIDFTRQDEVLPHPVYGLHGWACVLRPGGGLLPEVDRLLAHAHARAVDRHRRAGGRPGPDGGGNLSAPGR